VTSRVLPITSLILEMPRFDAIIDSRTPAEFNLDHIPGSVNFPVLSDEERVEIGTLYKQSSPFVARKRGAVLVARNIARHIEESFAALPRNWRPLVYCWRGGQRSKAMAHVLGEVGWSAHQLEHGYKGFRGIVVKALESLPAQFTFIVLCGPTGSGKSALLRALKSRAQVLDLEALAAHRGSVLGAIDDVPQPSQKAFETKLWQALFEFDPSRPVIVESEGARIGRLSLPTALTQSLRESRCLRIGTLLKERVQHLLLEYPGLMSSPETLKARLQSLVGLHSRTTVAGWQALATEQRFAELVEALLEYHYDPAYRRSLASDYRRLDDAPEVKLEALEGRGFERAVVEILELSGGVCEGAATPSKMSRAESASL